MQESPRPSSSLPEYVFGILEDGRANASERIAFGLVNGQIFETAVAAGQAVVDASPRIIELPGSAVFAAGKPDNSGQFVLNAIIGFPHGN